MNIDGVRFILQYWKLKSYLCHELGYKKEKAEQTIAELRKMEPVILRKFLTWFRTDELPKEPVNDVHIQDIMKQCSMNPVAAFLALNWVQTDPTAAKYSLSRPVDTLILSESDEEALRRIAKKRGWATPEEAAEDTSDIAEPEDQTSE